ncbi:dTDP-glucose 4,6-dehydratase [Paucilactobacillus wasatchensis]|uniref:dTDP-glucose 4,6-dehydratase n=1 Tax=Paucilactobacillus wasatchensis TaxID=1335616 RepID=A0A0D1A9D3_9LACO|nr:dTDP-glucose 4,6-dehydratase [Paucilactobacillus wasatchensis]KIS04337.1 dTDP-glucose 4,6-dehydratase [Paucilactobacillus wasatchensis]
MVTLVTGGAGFIGSNFIHYMLNNHPDIQIVNLDVLTYAGNIHSLDDIKNDARHHFVHGNINDRDLVIRLVREFNVDCIVNFAAESHVDRSILDPATFVETNVQGTLALLDVAKNEKITKFVQVSTDEVYGTLGAEGYFTETSPLQPNSPYSASKASADLLVRSYHQTYGLNVNITRCSNNYGPYQFPEKLIPLMVSNGIEGKRLPIYGDGKNIRDWLYVSDHCRAIDLVLHQGKPGEIYNIGGRNERTNNEIAHLIVDKLGLSPDLIQYVQDRPGHDRRYAINPAKIESELGWGPEVSFADGIAKTIKWYQENVEWWQPLKARM